MTEIESHRRENIRRAMRREIAGFEFELTAARRAGDRAAEIATLRAIETIRERIEASQRAELRG